MAEVCNHAYITSCSKEKYIEETVNTKFLGVQIDNLIIWKNHTDQMISTLSGACYAVKSIVHISNINTLKSIYSHSIIKYGIIFGGNSFNSENIFTSQNKVFRIITNEPLVEVYLNK